MTSILKIGIVSIPIKLVNMVNSRYSTSSLHLFSKCCNSPVKNKQVCESCNNPLSKEDIQKGIDKDTILSKEQEKQLKDLNENGILEVLSLKDITETTTYDILPFVIKSQALLPSISKGYRKTDIKSFYSFLNAIKDLNKYALCKYVNRSCEHIGIIIHYKTNFLFLELPFKHYNNLEEIDSDKVLIENAVKKDNISDLTAFSEQAKTFINTFKGRVGEINEITEEKKALLNQLVEEVKTGIKPTQQQEVKEEINPFAI